ncbi:nucleotidyltransferase domain-containing protein [Clostridium sp. C8-1-8]|uniref:nucleotidyltransferase domain-containing protein n=1 Tax=Clostridium sp. C8-1-8 TaxID=2698831 RepID=UPI00137193A7|nr:nucleotidyltransferase domain-containing protein [Clostridium sp. C8-1-8]
MSKEILRYQKAFNSVVERLKKNKDVLAVMVFGSMVTGDLWQGSDIDIFVIIGDDDKDIRNIYTEENNISVHMKLLSKDNFLNFNKNNIAGSYMHRILISSKLIFSNDENITNIFNSFRYISDSEREKWNLVYLGNILKEISQCKKLIANNSIQAGYLACMKAVEQFCSLFLNYNGYMVSKDVISVASNLDDTLQQMVDNLISQGDNLESEMTKTIDFIEAFLDKNIKNCCVALIKFFRENKNYMSSEEIKKHNYFNDFEIHMEDILIELASRKILKKGYRSIKSLSGSLIGEENVYC